MTKLEEFRADIRAMGLAGWFLYGVDRALNRISRGRMRLWAFWFYAQTIPPRPLLVANRSGKIQVGPLADGAIDLALFDRPPGAIEERFAAGSVCIAVIDGEKLAGFMWLHFGKFREYMLECDFEPLPPALACWDFDLEISPEYRLGRTFARLWDEANRLLRERGVAVSVSWVKVGNLASQRAHQRMGALRLGWLAVLDLFGLKLAARSAWPFMAIALPGRRLSIQVDASSVLAAAQDHST